MTEHEPAATTFDLDAYLADRQQRDSFVIVEIGHGARPIVTEQIDLTGQRAYVGVETWMRDPSKFVHSKIQKLNKELADQNVTFVDQPISGRPVYDPDAQGPSTEFIGGYDPKTILPDAAADEVFVGNVFGDYHIAYNGHHRARLLEEVARLIGQDGIAVVRETITPHISAITEPNLEKAGLQELVRIPDNYSRWRELEEIYDIGDWGIRSNGSFYSFIGKKAL